MKVKFTKDDTSTMRYMFNVVNVKDIEKLWKGGEEMLKIADFKVIGSCTRGDQGAISFRNITENCAEEKADETRETEPERDKMKVWGMLSPEDEEAGFGLYLDSDCYVLLLYYKDGIVALFDPNDYTMPELRDVVDKVIEAVHLNPMVVCAGNVLWSRN